MLALPPPCLSPAPPVPLGRSLLSPSTSRDLEGERRTPLTVNISRRARTHAITDITFECAPTRHALPRWPRLARLPGWRRLLCGGRVQAGPFRRRGPVAGRPGCHGVEVGHEGDHPGWQACAEGGGQHHSLNCCASLSVHAGRAPFVAGTCWTAAAANPASSLAQPSSSPS